MLESFPPTVIVRHRRERLSKCTLQPLVGRSDMRFLTYPSDETVELEGYVRLSLEGPALSPADATCGLLLLDATWRLVSSMEKAYAHVTPRSLPPLQTAYPRVSKTFSDPNAGLASIEALAAAYVALGRPITGLLDHYPWAEAFVERNAKVLAGLRAVAK